LTRVYETRGLAVHGDVEGGYGPVVDEFARNFVERSDVGSGCTVYVDGRKVVDIWAGIADRRTGAPWTAHTAAVIFSCTKGVMAICAYLLVQNGVLDLDRPIADYWPEFGQAGKQDITLRQAMSHRAGLSYLDRDLTLADVAAWHPVIRAIEEQAPHSSPAEGWTYHAVTYGWIVGEVIRRVTGLTPGTWFRRHLADPLDLDAWIGVPEDERGKVAWMEPPLPDDDSEFARGFASLAGSRMVQRAMSMGSAFPFPAADGRVTFNDPRIQAAEVPGAGGVASPGALARLYAACISGIDGPPLLTPATIADASRVQSSGRQLTGQPDDGARWGTGFQVSSPPAQPMLGPRSFGHTGAGGQLAFADPELNASFAYITNQMGGYGDARARMLTQALSDVLRRGNAASGGRPSAR
jgi:CubicO group peptidase (beta-lactamase class C family)